MESREVIKPDEYPLVVRSQIDNFKREQMEVCGQLRESLYDILSGEQNQNLPDTKMLQSGGLNASNSALKGGITYIQNQSVNIQVNTHVVECLRMLDSMLNRILLFSIPDPPPRKIIRRKRRKSNGD